MPTKIRFYYLWDNIVRKFFPYKGRQDYMLMKIDPQTLSKEEFAKRLISLGYQFNYFSYEDKGEIMNLRKLYISSDSTIRQYHIRYYTDGEIRAHDELSYEEDAIGHRDGVSMTEIPIEEVTLIVSIL